mgnify:CR=1 FL=1
MSGEVFYALVTLMGATVFTVMLMVLTSAYKRRLSFKERQLELMAQHTAEKAAQYAADKQTLEARVRVLERIATSSGADLSHEIELLRGPVN